VMSDIDVFPAIRTHEHWLHPFVIYHLTPDLNGNALLSVEPAV